MSLELSKKVKEYAKSIGYMDCGITTAEPFDDFKSAVDQMLERFPDISDLYEWLLRKVDPHTVAPWANSIVVCIRNYGKYDIPDNLSESIAKNYLCDSRHPEHPDYLMRKNMASFLKGEMGFRILKGRVPDREVAVRSGVANFGKNCFAYSKDAGSWINIETWMVDAKLAPDEPNAESVCPDGCRACMDACPTGAIVEPNVMRMDRCIAYLTYEAPEPVKGELLEKMGKWIYGCDVCQNVCPANKGKWTCDEKIPWPASVLDALAPASLMEMDEAVYKQLVHPRFWYISIDNIERWRKNAKRALGEDIK